MAVDEPLPSLTVTDSPPSVDTLVVGVSEFGLAGLTAVDYLVEQLGTAQSGHLAGGREPAIVPFEGGEPRHHTRLYADADDLAVGVFTTPVHAQAPDAAAAIRLVEALSTVHDLAVDTGPLEAFAESVEPHYRALADRVAAQTEAEKPDDRMYM